MFTSAAILLSYFGEERSGRGGGYSLSYTCICKVGVPLDLKMHGAY